MVFYLHHTSNPAGSKFTDYDKYALIMYNLWVLYANTLWVDAGATDQVIRDAWVKLLKRHVRPEMLFWTYYVKIWTITSNIKINYKTLIMQTMSARH